MGLVLVVEDHFDTREMVQTLLRHWGHETLGAETAEAGLALLATEKPKLIIVDGMMPGMNGAEFIRLVRTNEATMLIPIVLYTAVTDQIFIDNAIEKGANEIWIKGQVETDEMRERIAHYAA